MKKESLFKTKKITSTLAIVALGTGFYFLNSNRTGNVILESGSSFNCLGLIGLCLIACSLILGVDSIRKK